jgi:hypothetical protein
MCEESACHVMTSRIAPAQQMYVKRGYTPDGRGIMCDWWPVTPGASIPIDDDAVLVLTRRLR